MKEEYPPEKLLLILKGSRLLNQFDDNELIKLIGFSRVEYFESGSTILQEGTHNKNIYLLMRGSVAVYVGDELILRLRRVGDVIGEMSVITNSLTAASVVAEREVALFVIPSGNIYDSGHPDLHSLWFKIFSDILADKLTMTNRKLIGYQATSAELNRKREELVQKSMILQSVMGSMSDGVVITDNQGRVLHVNDAFIKMVETVNLPEDYHLWPERIGFFEPDGKTICSASEIFVETGGESVEIEHSVPVQYKEICVKNNTLQEDIWLHATSSTVKNSDGTQLGGTVVVFRDYTRKKHEELALIEAKENAEATAKAKSYFLSIMSHELRNPLNAILGMSDLLLNTGVTEEQGQYIENITLSSRELLGKIRNILEFNHLESGDIELNNIPYCLAHLIEDRVSHYSDMARDKEIALKIDMERVHGTVFNGDPERIGQILGHIIENAIKFSDTGVVKLSVNESEIVENEINTVQNSKEKRVTLRFELSDQGIGLSEEQIESLFSPFSQADSSYSRRFEGSGLGLAISKRLIELMGGDIRVESEQGKGSCFIFTILQSRPVSSVAPQPSPSEYDKNCIKSFSDSKTNRKDPSDSVDSSEHGTLQILVAEDNKVNQMLIKKILTRLGYAPVVVENGLQAVEACENGQFDLVLMDIQMPEMDGLQASQRILKNIKKNAKVPTIVALTANINEGAKEECLAAGMSHYMSKPLKIEWLKEILSQLRD